VLCTKGRFGGFGICDDMNLSCLIKVRLRTLSLSKADIDSFNDCL